MAKMPIRKARHTGLTAARDARAETDGLPPPRIPGPAVGGPQRAFGGLGRERVAGIQRSRILGAMVEVVAERGAADVTVAHVVARSGVSRRTFYELFADREDCFLAAFDETIARIASVVVPAYEEPPRWPDRVRAGLIALLEIFEDDRAAARLVIVDVLGAGANALERRRCVLAHVIAVVEEGRTVNGKSGEIGGGDGSPPMVAEGIVGGVLAVLHSRLLGSPSPTKVPGRDGQSLNASDGDSLLRLAGPLMSMIVLPYLGAVAARKELARPVAERRAKPRVGAADPLRDLDMRLTYRTVRVLMAVAELSDGSCPSNREVGIAAGMSDQGQTSKLLSRLHRLGLIENTGDGPSKGAPNAWQLTPKGAEVEHALGQRSTGTHIG